MNTTRSRGGTLTGIPPAKNFREPTSLGAGVPHSYAKCI
nr:MAG TPA: hypothetical protein [Caudoviricetes sp.]DAX76558.1 MAG TPA: hypothetical protein [Caudoviricetes sp.]